MSPIFVSASFVFSQLINSRIGTSMISNGDGSQRSSEIRSVLSREMRSDSVTMPTSSIPSMTGRPPMWCFRKSATTSRRGVVAVQTTGSFVIASFTSIIFHTSGKHPGSGKAVLLGIPAHQVHVLDCLTAGTFHKVVDCRYRYDPEPFALHHQVAEVAPADRGERGFLVADKVLALVKVLVDPFHFLLPERFIKEDMGGGQDAPVDRDEVGSEVAFRLRAKERELLLHLGKVAMGRPLVRPDIIPYIRVMRGYRRVVPSSADTTLGVEYHRMGVLCERCSGKG